MIAEAALEQCFVAGLAWSWVTGCGGGKDDGFAGAKDAEAVCRAAAGIGSVYFCPDCRESDLSAVSSGWIAGSAGEVVTKHHALEEQTAGDLGS